MASQFDYVLVDEYQDVNSLQVDIVRRLCPEGRGLTVVGDDAQAVYGFRGSDASYLHDLATEVSGTTVVALEQNYRSTAPILTLANAVRPVEAGVSIVLRPTRPGGRRPLLVRCHDAPGEARAVVDAVLEQHGEGRPLRDQAVLARAAHHSDLVELELTARRVPYRKYGGLRFLEAAHVKDFVAIVRLLDNPSDELAWYRVLRLHDGIGPSRARLVLEALRPASGRAAEDWGEAVAAAPARARVALQASLEGLSTARHTPATAERVARCCAVLEPLLRTRYDRSDARIEDLWRLSAAAAASEDLSGWLAELTLDPPRSTSERAGPPHLDDDYVVISTVHSAKGLEWPVVHLLHLVDGAFPSDMALTSAKGLEEERRLFYVASTRARDELRLYTPLRMPHHRRSRDDRHSYAVESRFIDDGAKAALEVRELVPPRPSAAAVPTAAAVAVDLDLLWR